MATKPNHVICQVRLYPDNGLAEDISTNTFHFRKPAGVDYATAAGSIRPVLSHFYNQVATGATNKISGYLANGLKTGTNQAEVASYDGSIPPNTRVPTITQFTLGAPLSGSELPTEVAVCASFKAVEAGVAPFAQQKGRVYLGPLCLSAGSVSLGAFRPDGTFLVDITKAMQKLQADIQALGTGYDWCVYSPTGNALYVVTSGWVDDAFDIQRRRGVRAASRITVTLP